MQGIELNANKTVEENNLDRLINGMKEKHLESSLTKWDIFYFNAWVRIQRYWHQKRIDMTDITTYTTSKKLFDNIYNYF